MRRGRKRTRLSCQRMKSSSKRTSSSQWIFRKILPSASAPWNSERLSEFDDALRDDYRLMDLSSCFYDRGPLLVIVLFADGYRKLCKAILDFLKPGFAGRRAFQSAWFVARAFSHGQGCHETRLIIGVQYSNKRRGHRP